DVRPRAMRKHMTLRSLFVSLFVINFASSAFAQTNCNRPPATLVAPADGAKSVASPVTFTWTPGETAVSYEVWASFNLGDFAPLGTTPTTKLMAVVDPDTTVEWYVVANYTACSTPSKHSIFSTGACSLAAATLLTPQEGAANVGSPVQFSW